MEDETTEEGGTGLSYATWDGIDEMDSLCMLCHSTGKTRFMLHKIPYFRELVIASFECEECGERNNEVTFGGEIQLQGCMYELKVTTSKDLDRQLIKSDSALIRIPDIDFEIPPMTQKGEISTIEGFLCTAAKNLGLYQDERMEQMPEVGAKVAEIIAILLRMSSGDYVPFTIVLDDVAGNSYIENLHAPAVDPHMVVKYYTRTPEQDASLGLQTEKGVYKDDKDSNIAALMAGSFGMGSAVNEQSDSVKLGRSEIISIPSPCPNCYKDGECLTAMTDIPHFKEVIIMAFNCNECGYRNNEIKGGGAVPTYGTLVSLKVRSYEDLKRDVLKSDSALVIIPEIELEMQSGTLGGVYTTMEGLLKKIHANLMDGNPFAVGDSIDLHHSTNPEVAQKKVKFNEFMDRLQDMASGREFNFTVTLRDPLGNSFISAPLGTFLPPEADSNLTIEDFERSFEENEDIGTSIPLSASYVTHLTAFYSLGLNDINTRDFETGVEYQEMILPDRLTHVIPKGADHPTVFAKGMSENDTTEGGVYFVSTCDINFNKDSKSVDWTAHPHVESKAQEEPDRLPPVAVKRDFDPNDKLLEFFPYEEFSGARSGFVFRLGALGLGYYADKYQQL